MTIRLLFASLCRTLAVAALSLPAVGCLRAEENPPPPPPPPHAMAMTVQNRSLSRVSPRVFGQFMERASGETGPEGGLKPGTSELRDDIVRKLDAMDIPVIRFPGGTEIDFADWRDLIDNVPGRAPGRPVSTIRLKDKDKTQTNRFGYDEYFRQVRDRFGCETDLVVNLLDAAANRKPIHEAALDACGLLAYANAPQGAKLPEGMPDWPGVRGRNGHPAPYKTEYIQIGNETWVPNFWKVVRAAWPDKTDAELAAHYHACVSEYVRVLREIDPQVGIIIDLRMPFNAAAEVYADPFLLKHVNLMAYHVYQPGRLTNVQHNGKTYPSTELTPDEIWNYWTMMPAWAGTGLVDHIPRDEPGLRAGLKIAVTEWNWLRFQDGGEDERLPFHWAVPGALGVARNLHGMIRAGDRLAFATQSMLVGSHWRFASVFFHEDTPDSAAFSVQGQVTDFYRHTVGKELLPLEVTAGLETLSYHAPGSTEKVEAGAAVDPLATRDGQRLLVHVINRYREAPVEAAVRFDGFGPLADTGRLQTLTRDITTKTNDGHDPFTVASEPVTIQDGTAHVVLPRPGIYVLEVTLREQ